MGNAEFSAVSIIHGLALIVISPLTQRQRQAFRVL